MVYGEFDGKEVTENTECKPIGVYGALKFSGELIFKAYGHVAGLPYTIIIRPCTEKDVLVGGSNFYENAIQNLDIKIKVMEKKLDFTYIDDLIQEDL